MSDFKYLFIMSNDYTESDVECIKSQIQSLDSTTFYTLSFAQFNNNKLSSSVLTNYLKTSLEALEDKKIFNFIFLTDYCNEYLSSLRFVNIIRKKDYKPYYNKLFFNFFDINNNQENYVLDFSLGVADILRTSSDIFTYEFSLSLEDILTSIKNKNIFCLFRNVENNFSIIKDKYIEAERLLRAYNIKTEKKSFKSYYMNLRYCLVDVGSRQRKKYRQLLEDVVFSFYLQKDITKQNYLSALEDFKHNILLPNSQKEHINIDSIIDFAKSTDADELKNKVQASIEEYKQKGHISYYTEEDLKDTSLLFFDLNYMLALYVKKYEK